MSEIKTRTTATPARLKLVAANARASLALANQPRYRVASGARHMPGLWYVESNRDPDFSASGQYHALRSGAEMELVGLNCKTEAEYAAHLLSCLQQNT